MKTAMQEWFHELKSNYPYLADIVYKKGFKKYLEKEKQQIIEAFDFKRNNSHLTGFDDEYVNVGEEYYNKTYNQNI